MLPEPPAQLFGKGPAPLPLVSEGLESVGEARRARDFSTGDVVLLLALITWSRGVWCGEQRSLSTAGWARALLRAQLCSGCAVRAGRGAAAGGLCFQTCISEYGRFTWLAGSDLQLWGAG